MPGERKLEYSTVQYNVHEGSHHLIPQVHKICMNGAHETIRNNRPDSFTKVFIYKRYCQLWEGTHTSKVVKSQILKYMHSFGLNERKL